jgi:hypothetical protein
LPYNNDGRVAKNLLMRCREREPIWAPPSLDFFRSPRSRLASARHEPSHDFLVRIAPKFVIWIAPTAMELVLLDDLFSELDNLFSGLSLILWKGHPLANDFAARLVVFFFHVRGSLAYFSGRRPRPIS